MGKKQEKIKEELEKEEKEFYGDETVSGSDPAPDSDDDTVQNLADVIGKGERLNSPREE